MSPFNRCDFLTRSGQGFGALATMLAHNEAAYAEKHGFENLCRGLFNVSGFLSWISRDTGVPTVSRSGIGCDAVHEKGVSYASKNENCCVVRSERGDFGMAELARTRALLGGDTARRTT